MDALALAIGFGVGVVVTAVVAMFLSRLGGQRQSDEVSARLAHIELDANRRSAVPPTSLDSETRAGLMAELGEKTLELAELRKRTADYAALKAEILDLRPKIEALALAEAELDLARAHAQKLREELARASHEAASLGAENAKLSVDLASYRERMAAVERTTSTLVSHLRGAAKPEPETTGDRNAHPGEDVRPAIDPAKVGPLPLAPLAAVAMPDGRDPLSQIPGVGPIFEKRLWEGGIMTFADLAAKTPEQVIDVIKPEHWQQIEPEPWIVEARSRADG